MATKKTAEKVIKITKVASATSVTQASKISKPSSFSTKGIPWEAIGSVLSTFSAPSTLLLTTKAIQSLPTEPSRNLAAQKMAGENKAANMPTNPLKAGEYGLENGHHPAQGPCFRPSSPMDTASTVTEKTLSAKTGAGHPVMGSNTANAALDRFRTDAGGHALTTNMGLKISDNQNSLKAGLRGPTLLEDFVLREKITHFDHERIPERIVHARGSAAHGYFESYSELSMLTKAAPFSKANKRTPVFARFSTVVGERGSADLARDVRGFAVKFYSEEGNWDIVGNNMPVFFIQDAIKFPDLVHSLKPEPHHQMPQAASAHDTFWDFASLMPESTHMLLWVMSDRAIPRSYRMMQGFGVHTFRLVNENGDTVFCKFHWNPTAGTHSVLWDEAVKINGADSDFHRRDLWEAIEAGVFPEWELGFQVFTAEQADSFSFDVLDATKLIPEELVPIQLVGRMVLNRNPDNFFAETEQVAFGTANIIPGIDFSNDPLLQGRHHSYLDTQLSRLGGPNFHQLPINASLAPTHNNQRDGMHQQSIPRGRVAYEPNSLGGGCPFQSGMKGFVTFPDAVTEDKVRGKPEKFADHYTQAKLFWNSQTQVEKNHIVGAFRFELTRVQTQAIRERVVSLLANVDDELAGLVANGLGFVTPVPQAKVLENPGKPEITQSPALSLFARPGDGNIKTRRVALVVCNDINGDDLREVHAALVKAGAVPRFIGVRLGMIGPGKNNGEGQGKKKGQGKPIHCETTFETAPAVLWDAVVLPDGLRPDVNRQIVDFIKEQYRHCKPIMAIGSAWSLLASIGIKQTLPGGKNDAGLIIYPAEEKEGKNSHMVTPQTENYINQFIESLSMHRHFNRETNPPLI